MASTPTWWTKGDASYAAALSTVATSPATAEIYQYARQRADFALWLHNVSRRLAPFSLFDLPDFASADWFEAGMTPAEACAELRAEIEDEMGWFE